MKKREEDEDETTRAAQRGTADNQTSQDPRQSDIGRTSATKMDRQERLKTAYITMQMHTIHKILD